jgi:hypothetical protein
MNQTCVAEIANDYFRQLDQFIVLHKVKHVLLPDLYGEMLDVAAVREDANVYIDPWNERLGNEGEKLYSRFDRISLCSFSFEQMTRTPKLLHLFVGFRTKGNPTVTLR